MNETITLLVPLLTIAIAGLTIACFAYRAGYSDGYNKGAGITPTPRENASDCCGH